MLSDSELKSCASVLIKEINAAMRECSESFFIPEIPLDDYAAIFARVFGYFLADKANIIFKITSNPEAVDKFFDLTIEEARAILKREKPNE